MGGLLQQAGVPASVAAMVADLHSGTWLSVGTDPLGDLTEVVETLKGARQGCQTGALIFNVIYELALKRIRDKARAAGLLSVIPYHVDHCPWGLHPDATARLDARVASCAITAVTGCKGCLKEWGETVTTLRG